MSEYQILEQLGQGSYGIVHKVQLRKSNGMVKIYAMKIVDLTRLTEEDFRRTREEVLFEYLKLGIYTW